MFPFSSSPRSYPTISEADRKLIGDSKMDTEMENHVMDCCKRAFENHTSDADRAEFIVNEFDEEYSTGWQCVIGNCASFVSYKNKCFIRLENYRSNNVKVLLFKC